MPHPKGEIKVNLNFVDEGVEGTIELPEGLNGNFEYEDTTIVLTGKVTTISITKTVGVSVNPVQDCNDLNLYPNPATNFIEIHSKNSRNKNYHLEIFGISGKVILWTENLNSGVKIDISNFTNGIYFAKVFGNNGFVSVHKFIKY